MSQFVSPGVYIVERDFSDYVAALQATSVGMVGTAQKGPLNAPTLCTTPEQFLSIFGTPTPNMYGPFAALNYLRRGNQLWYNRIAAQYTEDVTTLTTTTTVGATAIVVADTSSFTQGDAIRIRQGGLPTTVTTVATVTDGTHLTLATGTLAAYTDSADSDCTIDHATSTTAANQAEVFAYTRINGVPVPTVKFTAVNPGKWANFGTSQGIEIVIEDSGQFQNINPSTGQPIQSTNGVPLQGVVTTAPSVDSKAELLALTVPSIAVGQLRGVNYDAPTYVITNVVSASGTATITVGDTTGLIVGSNVTVTCSNVTFNGTHVLTAKSGTTISFALVTTVTSAAATGTVVLNDGPHFGIVYRCTSVSPGTWVAVGVLTKRVKVLYQGRQVEVFDNLIGYDATSPNYWDTVIGSATGTPVSQYVFAEYIGVTGEQPICTLNKVNFPLGPRLLMGSSTTVKISDTDPNAGSQTFKNALGADGENPGSADYIGTITSDGVYSGLQNFRQVSEFDINLLCVPAVTLPAVIDEIIDVCESRNDCLGILDTPFGLTVQEAVDWHNGTGPYTGLQNAFVSNKAALYYPWVKVFDAYTQREIWLPPSALVPGVIAYSDQVGEIWFAPAGINRGVILDALAVETPVSQGDMDLMYGPGNGNAINPIVNFPQSGITVYGQRTLQRVPTALDRINVRRMLFFVEKSVATSVRSLVFEQDDPILWGRFVALVTPFLQSLVGQRAIEDFRVVCDATTNTAQMRNNNEVGAKLLIIPTKSAEKIVLDFTLLASGANFNEFILTDANSGTAF